MTTYGDHWLETRERLRRVIEEIRQRLPTVTKEEVAEASRRAREKKDRKRWGKHYRQNRLWK